MHALNANIYIGSLCTIKKKKKKLHPWGQKFVTTYDSGSHCQRIAFLGFVLHVVYMKGPMAHLCKWWNFSLTCSVVENNILINISDLSHQLSFIKDSKYLCYGYYMFCSCSKHHYSGLNSWKRLFFECSKCFFFFFFTLIWFVHWKLEWNILKYLSSFTSTG